MVPAKHPSVAGERKKRSRRLKPEAAAELAARRRQVQVQSLYERPVHELERDEIALMRAAFLRG